MDPKETDEVQETLETPAEEEQETSEEPEESTEEQSEEQSEDEDVETLKERLRKAEAAIEKSKQKAKKERKAPSKSEEVNDAVLARLEFRGVTEPEDQQYVLRVAKAEGMSPVEAAQIDFVQDRLNANKRAREQKAATPKSSKRTGSGGTDIDALVRKYEERGELPNNPKLVTQILNRLTKK